MGKADFKAAWYAMKEDQIKDQLMHYGMLIGDNQKLLKDYEIKRSAEEDPKIIKYYDEKIKEHVQAIEKLEREASDWEAKLYELNKSAIEGKCVWVPFVVAAMTREEASSLMTETALKDPKVSDEEREQFKKFKEALKKYGCENFISFYGQCRENWRPYFDQEQSIQEIIEEICEHMNVAACSANSNALQIKPQFRSKDFFDEDKNKRLEIWDQLNNSSGVIIVDAISLFYPSLRRMLLRSGISSRERVALLVIQPMASASAFEDLPNNWVCPKCGERKERFKKQIEEA